MNPAVVFPKLLDPKPVLYVPFKFKVNALYPTAVFKSPAITASNAVVPSDTLYSAVEVEDDGSCPT